MIKHIIIGVLALIAVVLAVNVFGPGESLGNKTASFWDTTLGYKVGGTTVINSSGVLTPVGVSGPSQVITATTDTLVATDLGHTIFVSAASGTTITLPAATNGAFLRFVITSLFDTANVIIDSAEGDNIEGSLIVAGAVVDCDAEDQINFVNDGENLGDFVELTSNGTSWFIGGSGALTSAKLTCTDPS